MNCCLLACAVSVALAPSPRAEDASWPEFRGPTGQGLVEKGGLPTEWSTTKNVAWKQTIPGGGWSSPVSGGGRIYITTGVPVPGTKDQSMRAMCRVAQVGK